MFLRIWLRYGAGCASTLRQHLETRVRIKISLTSKFQRYKIMISFSPFTRAPHVLLAGVTSPFVKSFLACLSPRSWTVIKLLRDSAHTLGMTQLVYDRSRERPLPRRARPTKTHEEKESVGSYRLLNGHYGIRPTASLGATFPSSFPFALRRRYFFRAGAHAHRASGHTCV